MKQPDYSTKDGKNKIDEALNEARADERKRHIGTIHISNEAFHAAATSIFEELDKCITGTYMNEANTEPDAYDIDYHKYEALKRKYTNPSPENGSSKSVEGKEEG